MSFKLSQIKKQLNFHCFFTGSKVSSSAKKKKEEEVLVHRMYASLREVKPSGQLIFLTSGKRTSLMFVITFANDTF